MTVYAVNPTRDDISSAYSYGPVKFINPRYIYGDEIEDSGLLPERFRKAMHASANQFDPDRDYLLIVGDHLQFLAFAAMLANRHPYFMVLRYDRNERAYIPIRVEGTRSETP